LDTTLRSRSNTVVIGPDHPFVIIGERINPTGRKKLAAEMAEGSLETVISDVKAQVAAGAHVLDVNAGVPGADEAQMMKTTILGIMETADIPLCIDSSTHAALESGLSVYDGKALVNSVTGENESLERVLPLVKKHGAAVIGMCNDGVGISMDPQVRLGVAKKILAAALDHGIPREDVLFDPLVMTVGADSQAARVSLETIKLIRQELDANMSCGASNVSFGLPDRHGIDAAFLPMAIMAGLTSAITNPLTKQVRKAVRAADVLMGHDEWSAAWIGAHRAEQAQAEAGGQS
jgi:5-methyltetrahydrofolate--homocysteine methyltransferase